MELPSQGKLRNSFQSHNPLDKDDLFHQHFVHFFLRWKWKGGREE
jgi:hypothetical protein